MRPDGSRERALTTSSRGFFTDPAYSPNGKKIAYARYSDDITPDGNIYLMNADGTGKVNITRSPNRNEFSPAFYPSGRRIIFNAAPKGNLYKDQELYVISFDAAGNATGPPTRLTNNAFPDGPAVVSPNGAKIAFASHRGPVGPDEGFGDSDIYVMNTAPEGPSNPAVKLTDNADQDFSPNFSPNGSRVVYEGDRNGNSEILVMSATDGSGKKNLTMNPADDSAPVFSPNGNMIAFVRAGSDGGSPSWTIWKMRADGSRQTKLSDTYEQLSSGPDWRPLP